MMTKATAALRILLTFSVVVSVLLLPAPPAAFGQDDPAAAATEIPEGDPVLPIIPDSDVMASAAVPTEYLLPPGAPFSEKYVRIRTRFLEYFFFDGSIAEWRSDTKIHFADQVVYMSFALVAFAGEARILARAGLNTRPSELVISRILAEFDKLDNEAEQKAYGTNVSGFFVRDYVIPKVRPQPDRLKGLEVHSDWQDRKKNDMSQDQAIHILMGLWAVKEWAPDRHFDNRTVAKRHTQRLIDYLKRQAFLITRPNSNSTPVDRGAYAYGMAGFMLNIASRTLDSNQARGAQIGYPISVNQHYHAETSRKCVRVLGVSLGCIPRIVWWDFDVKWNGQVGIPAQAAHATVLDVITANQSLKNLKIHLVPPVCPAGLDSVIDHSITKYVNAGITAGKGVLNGLASELRKRFSGIPDFNIDCAGLVAFTIPGLDLGSFVQNMILVGAAFEPALSESTFKNIADECSAASLDGYGHIWSRLLRATMDGRRITSSVIGQANRWLDAMPNTGPVGSKSGNRIWFKDNRWVRCGDTDVANDAKRLYNGLDYLSLDVLVHLQPQREHPVVYVSKRVGLPIELGIPGLPYSTIRGGIQGALRQGARQLRIESGHYSENLVLNRTMRLEAVGGPVTIGVRPSLGLLPPDTTPRLAVSATKLDMQATAGSPLWSTETFSITNGNLSSIPPDLSWTASTDAAWLKLSTSEGAAPSELSVSVDNRGLTPGTHNGKITIHSEGASQSPQTVEVSLHVAAADTSAQLQVTPQAIEFEARHGTTPTVKSLIIANGGTGTLVWSAKEATSWFDLSAMAGSEPTTIQLIPKVAGLGTGVYTGTVVISSSTSSVPSQTVAVSLEIRPADSEPSDELLVFLPVAHRSAASEAVVHEGEPYEESMLPIEPAPVVDDDADDADPTADGDSDGDGDGDGDGGNAVHSGDEKEAIDSEPTEADAQHNINIFLPAVAR